MSQLTDVIEMAESVIATQQAEISRLNSQIELMKSFSQQPLYIKEYDFENIGFLERVTETQAELKSDPAVDSQTQKIHKLESEIGELNTQLADKKKEIDQYVSEINKYTSEAQESQKKIKELEDRIRRVSYNAQDVDTVAFRDLQVSYENEREHSKELEDKVKQAEADYKTLEANYKTLDLEKTKLERRCEDLTQKLTKAQEKVEQRSAKAAHENLQKKENEYRKLKKDYDKLQSSFNAKQKELAELQAKYDALLKSKELPESPSPEEKNLPAGESEATSDVTITKEHLSRLINALQNEQEETAKRLKKLDADLNAERSNPSNFTGLTKNKPVMTKRAKRRVSSMRDQLQSTQAYSDTVKTALEALTSSDVSMTDFAKKVYDSLLASGEIDNENLAESTKLLTEEVIEETAPAETDTEAVEEPEALNKESDSNFENLTVSSESVKEYSSRIIKVSASNRVEKPVPYNDSVNIGTLFDKNCLTVIEEAFCAFGNTPDEVLRAKYGINSPEMHLTEYGIKVMKSVTKYLIGDLGRCSELAPDNPTLMTPLIEELDHAYKHISEEADLCGYDRLYYIACKLEDERETEENLFTAERTLPKPDKALFDAIKKEVAGAVLFANPVEHSLSFFHTKSEKLGEETRKLIEAGTFPTR